MAHTTLIVPAAAGRLDVGAILAASWQPLLAQRRSGSVICKAAFRPSVHVLPVPCCKDLVTSVGKLIKTLMQVPRPRFRNDLSTPTV